MSSIRINPVTMKQSTNQGRISRIVDNIHQHEKRRLKRFNDSMVMLKKHGNTEVQNFRDLGEFIYNQINDIEEPYNDIDDEHSKFFNDDNI